MYAFTTVASLVLLLASRVYAGVYVTSPVQSSSYAGGESCDVVWVDDGTTPTLSSIGECTVGLYTGEFVLAQSLPSVDVSTTSTFSFNIDPTAGPDGQYYIVFTAQGITYTGFSGSFTLTGMTGTTPGGGSSAPVPTTTATNSSTPTDTTAAGTTTPTDTNTSTPTDTTTASVTTPATTGTPTATSPTTTTTATTTKATTTTTTSASPTTTTNAAGRVGSSSSLGGAAALLVLSGVLAF